MRDRRLAERKLLEQAVLRRCFRRKGPRNIASALSLVHVFVAVKRRIKPRTTRKRKTAKAKVRRRTQVASRVAPGLPASVISIGVIQLVTSVVMTYFLLVFMTLVGLGDLFGDSAVAMKHALSSDWVARTESWRHSRPTEMYVFLGIWILAAPLNGAIGLGLLRRSRLAYSCFVLGLGMTVGWSGYDLLGNRDALGILGVIGGVALFATLFSKKVKKCFR